MKAKSDFMQALSFKFIQTERTNSELESVENVGKIDGKFYRHFLGRIMGKQLKETEDEAICEVEHKLDNASLNGKMVHRDKVVVHSRTDFNGRSPKRYTSTCHLKPITTPSWYSESLVIQLANNKKEFDEKTWYKTKMQPYHWSETVMTEVNQPPDITRTSQLIIPVPDCDAHYISLIQ